MDKRNIYNRSTGHHYFLCLITLRRFLEPSLLGSASKLRCSKALDPPSNQIIGPSNMSRTRQSSSHSSTLFMKAEHLSKTVAVSSEGLPWYACSNANENLGRPDKRNAAPSSLTPRQNHSPLVARPNL